jgi:hypothetical protein
MRASLTAVVIFIAALSVVGCSQSTSPAGPSSALTAPTSAQSRPGTSYVAAGSWHGKVTNHRFGFSDEFDVDLTEDADGNLHGETGNSVATFTRVATGRMIIYELSVFEDHTPCDTTLSGPARLDTTTDTMQANISGIEQDCSRVSYSLTFTRNP